MKAVHNGLGDVQRLGYGNRGVAKCSPCQGF